MPVGKVLSELAHEFLKHKNCQKTKRNKKSAVGFQVNNFPPSKDHVLNQNTSVAASEAPAVCSTCVRSYSKLFHGFLSPRLEIP